MNLVLVLTDRCNRSCSYCYADRRVNGGMTFDIARRSIELARQRSQTPLRIGFFGGEPLMSFPLLREIADHARRVCTRAPRFVLTTNGDALTNEVAEYFAGIDVEVSLSAHDEDLLAIRRAATRLLDVGIRPSGVLVATAENCGRLVEGTIGLLDAGIRRIAISPEFYTPWTTTDRERLELAYQGLVELLLSEQRAGRPFGLNQLDPRLTALRSGVPLRETKCELGPELLTVAPDGSLFPCDRMAVDLLCAGTRIGHVDDGVDEEQLRQLVSERDRTPEDCRDCEHSVTCLGACACVNVHLCGAANAVPELVCWHETMAGRLARELLSLTPVREPARPGRGRCVRLTAGMLVAGSMTAACGDEPPRQTSGAEQPESLVTCEGAFDGSSFKALITDQDGEMGFAVLTCLIRDRPASPVSRPLPDSLLWIGAARDAPQTKRVSRPFAPGHRAPLGPPPLLPRFQIAGSPIPGSLATPS